MMNVMRAPSGSAVGGAFLIFTLTIGARAQAPVDAERAQRLFDEALSLSDQGRWSEACPKFRDSFATAPGVGALLNVAACSAREGKVSAARSEYRRALELNAATPDPERKRAIDAQAQQAIAELTGRLGRVVLRFDRASPGARVSIDGVAVEGGPSFEVDPGPHTVRVEAEGSTVVEAKITVEPGRETVVPVALGGAKGASTALVPPGARSANDRLAIAGSILGVAGALGVATSAVLYTLAADRASALRAECGPDVAPPLCPNGRAEIADELGREGRSLAIGAAVCVGVGGAAAASGVAMLIADAVMGSRREEARSVMLTAFVPAGGFGLGVEGVLP